MAYTYSRNDFERFFLIALDMFNECLDSDISAENVCIDFFVPANGIDVYERFCAKNFPKYLNERYKEDGFFDGMAAQALVGESCYGILIREDISFEDGQIVRILLHEISHLFCTRNEIPGGQFFDKYCMGSGYEDGVINAGYAIWRETVADIMADTIVDEYYAKKLSSYKRKIQNIYHEIGFDNPLSKKAMSLLIVLIMISDEVCKTQNWDAAEIKIKKVIGFTDSVMYEILKLVFYKLNKSPFWEITDDFIFELGDLYLGLLTTKALRGER